MLPHEYTYALYLSYEYDLYPSHPWILHMVSERYPEEASTDDLDSEEEEALDSVEDCASNCDEEFISNIDEEAIAVPSLQQPSTESAVMEDSHSNLNFGSFGDSDLDAMSVTPMTSIKLIKPTIDGSTIKIGEITCALVNSRSSTFKQKANGDSSINDATQPFLDPELEFEEATIELQELITAEAKIVVAETDEKSKELVGKERHQGEHHQDPSSHMLQQFDLPSFDSDRIISTSINSFCDFGSESSCFALNVAPINHGSITIDRPTPAPPWFSTSEQRRGFDVLDEALKRQVVTAVFAVGSCVWLSDLTGVHTVVFDPGGTLEAASGGCKIEIDLDAICITTFDPGGTLNAVSISATPPHHSVFVVDPGGAASAISSPPLQCSVFVFDPGGYRHRSLLIAAIIPLALIAAVIPFALSFVRVQLGKGFDEWHY